MINKYVVISKQNIIVINNVVKIYLQVKNENKTPFIPVFQVIFKDQCSEIFVQKFEKKLPRIEHEYQYSEENIQIYPNIRSYIGVFLYVVVRCYLIQ